MTGRRGGRSKQLLDDLQEKRRYWNLKEEAVDRVLWRPGFGRGYGPVVRMNDGQGKEKGDCFGESYTIIKAL